MNLEYNGAAHLARENEALHTLLAHACETLYAIATSPYGDTQEMQTDARECLARVQAGG